MGPQPITLHVDFTCPFSFLALAVLDQVQQQAAVEPRFVPFEVYPEPEPLPSYDDPAVRRWWDERVLPLADRLGVDLVLPPAWPRTRPALEVLAYAERHGVGQLFFRRAAQAYWQEQQDLTDPEVLAALAANCGLQPRAVKESLTLGTYHDYVADATARAHAMDIAGTPHWNADGLVCEGLPEPHYVLRLLELARDRG